MKRQASPFGGGRVRLAGGIGIAAAGRVAGGCST